MSQASAAGSSPQPNPDSPSLVDSLLVRCHGMAAFVALLISVTFGIILSLQFIFPDFTAGWLPGWGRLRFSHTQGIMLGWLGNAFLAFLYHAVPVLTGRPVSSRNLGLWLFGIWNFAVLLPGWVLVLSGVSQPLEWAEFPLVVDAFVLIGLLLAVVQFLPAFFQRGFANLYVSSWYIIGGLVFTLLSYPMGNVVPEFVPGAAGAAFSGLWIHDAVGLFVTPLALAILYFVVPASTGRPIYSHFLSMLGFWGLFFLYPLNGTHHYIFSVIPMEAQFTAIAASFLLGVIVVIVVTNLILSQRGAGLIPRDVGLRFVSMSVIFYLIVSVQGSLQANMSLNQTVHFSDWVIGHSHLAMLGFATFAGIGGIIHAWQRLPDARYNPRALDQAYWLLTLGVGIMVVDLTIAGIIQGQLWASGAPWLESVQASRPYWIIRSLSAIPIAAGFICLFVGLTTGARGAGALALNPSSRTADQPRATPAAVAPVMSSKASGVLQMSYVVAAVAGIGFFVLSVSLLGLWPRQVLEAQTAALAPPSPLPPTRAEERGRLIYAREGCGYCHSQQIRYTDADMARFGAPTLAWEGRFDFPHQLGTRRIGPDLSRTAATRTRDWHFAHLFAPRAVAPLSVMPAYPELFDGVADRPTREARDLVAYLDSLGLARELAWPEGDIAARAAAADNRWAQMSLNASLLNANPARTRPRGAAPALTVPAGNQGQRLWRDYCAGCHGLTGLGDGPGAAWLEPRPKNLQAREYSRGLLTDILWNGVAGTAMPAWRDQAPEDRAALIDVVRGLAQTDASPSATAAQLLQGQVVYQTHCAECHGASGAGDGFAAGQLPIAPTDFRGLRPGLDESIRVLRSGVAGTSMAPWTDRLSDAEIESVSHYLRQFYSGEVDR